MDAIDRTKTFIHMKLQLKVNENTQYCDHKSVCMQFSSCVWLYQFSKAMYNYAWWFVYRWNLSTSLQNFFFLSVIFHIIFGYRSAFILSALNYLPKFVWSHRFINTRCSLRINSTSATCTCTECLYCSKVFLYHPYLYK